MKMREKEDCAMNTEASLRQNHSKDPSPRSDDFGSHEYLGVYRSRNFREPETRLLAAVLEDALNCYMKYLFSETRKGRRKFQDAEAWLFKDEGDWLFSLESVCGVLSIDHAYIRRGLSRYKEKCLQRQQAA
jgi:hypothetical protein